MWTVECARCGNPIEAESPDEIPRDEDDNPRHEDCEYADEPSYPCNFTISIQSDERRIKRTLKRAFPHLTPHLNEQRLEHVVPDEVLGLGNVQLRYRAESDDGLWDADVSLTHVNGEPLVSQLPRLVYRCDTCGTQVDGKVVYDTDGFRPFTHTSCPDASRRETAQFRPVSVSHLDDTLMEDEENDVLRSYQAMYDE